MNQQTRLTNRAILAISGEDARNFLQGLITNDITKLSPAQPIYALMLNPQGRFLYDFFIYEYDGKILLDCNASKLEEIKKKLSMYKLRSKVVIEDVSKDLQVVVIARNEAKLNDVAIHLDTSESGSPRLFEARDDAIFVDPRSPKLPLRAITAYSPEEASIEDYERLRISLCIPSDMDMEFDKSFPLEYEMDTHNAIDYKKGCYVGQEVTARTHYRGSVRKKPYVVTGEIGTNLSQYKDQEITSGENKIGIMRSAAGNIGIALLRMEDLEKAEGNIEVAGVKVKLI